MTLCPLRHKVNPVAAVRFALLVACLAVPTLAIAHGGGLDARTKIPQSSKKDSNVRRLLRGLTCCRTARKLDLYQAKGAA